MASDYWALKLTVFGHGRPKSHVIGHKTATKSPN